MLVSPKEQRFVITNGNQNDPLFVNSDTWANFYTDDIAEAKLYKQCNPGDLEYIHKSWGWTEAKFMMILQYQLLHV